MEKYHIILGKITLIDSQTDGIIDDGTLAKKIAEILVEKLKEYGVGEVEIDFEKSVKIKK